MTEQNLGDLCRQIAAEHAGLGAGVQTPAAFGPDPLALIGRLDAYAEAIRDLSADVVDDVNEGPPR